MWKTDTIKQNRTFLVVSVVLATTLLVGWSLDKRDRREGKDDAREEHVGGDSRGSKIFSLWRAFKETKPESSPETHGRGGRSRSLARNPRLQIADGKHGVVLSSNQPTFQLVIDVGRDGECWVLNRKLTVEKIQELVKRLYLKIPDFPCMVRADRNARHGHVRGVFNACLQGRAEARKLNPNVSAEPKISLVALVEAHEDEDVYSRLDVYSPLPSLDLDSGDSGPWYANICEEEESLEAEPPPPAAPDVKVDTPAVTVVEVPKPAPQPVAPPFPADPSPAVPTSFKPATVDAVLDIKRPVKLKDTPRPARSQAPRIVTKKTPMAALRGAGTRGNFLKGGAQYGDANTERAVLMALRWLKATQEPDGTWGAKPELGLTRGMDRAAGAGFAVLTFLAHGETPDSPEFGPTVEKALNYLVNSVYVVRDRTGKEQTDPNGNKPYVKMRGTGGSEYGFLIGTYALCEAYAMTGDPNVKAAAEKALSRIISGQTPTGGWNYNMKRVSSEGAPDDISYGGWAMQALKAGKMAGIHLPGMEDCIKKAVKCLQTRNYSEAAGFVYRATTNHKRGGGCLAGAGCLCLQLFGCAKDPEVANALRVMTDWQPSLDAEYPYVKSGTRHNPQYYCYYAAQCKYQAGMAKNATPANLMLWKKWNTEMKKLYPGSIITVMDPKTNKPYTIQDANGKPREIGHWVNQDHYNYDVMSTCLAALQLMVYYRYLPTALLRATEVAPDVESRSKETTSEINVEVDI